MFGISELFAFGPLSYSSTPVRMATPIDGHDWTDWLHCAPPSDETVLIRRVSCDGTHRVIPSKMHPEWNVAGVSWRRIRDDEAIK